MRVDVPTLRCDRCLTTTQDLSEMGAYRTLVHYNETRREDRWDLCPACWVRFKEWLDGAYKEWKDGSDE